jgi:hypothetical protein
MLNTPADDLVDQRIPPLHKDKGNGYVRVIQTMVPNNYIERLVNIANYEDILKCKTLNEWIVIMKEVNMRISKSIREANLCRSALHLDSDPRTIDYESKLSNRSSSPMKFSQKLRMISEVEELSTLLDADIPSVLATLSTSQGVYRPQHNWCRFDIQGITCQTKNCPYTHYNGKNGKERSDAVLSNLISALKNPYLEQRTSRIILNWLERTLYLMPQVLCILKNASIVSPAHFRPIPTKR